MILADCAALAYTTIHDDFLKNKTAVLVCPKFEDAQQNLEKLTEMFKINKVKDISVVHMEVPCCHGLSRLVAQAVINSGLNIPLRTFEIGVKGNIKSVV